MSAIESRLTERAAAHGLEISAPQLSKLATYAELLERWNERINLTALNLDGWPDQTIDRLIFEPMAAVPLCRGVSGQWVDLGSGGGSPALPLAILLEGFALTLTESRGKKAAFLREAARALKLQKTHVLGRFEELLGWPAQSVALITCRAVKPEQAAAVVSHLLAANGRMLYFGSSPLDAIGALGRTDIQPLPGNHGVASVLQRSSVSTQL